MSIESVMPSSHPLLCCPLLPPSVFPASGSSPSSQLSSSAVPSSHPRSPQRQGLLQRASSPPLPSPPPALGLPSVRVFSSGQLAPLRLLTALCCSCRSVSRILNRSSARHVPALRAGASDCPRRACLSHRGSQGSPSLASGQGCLQTLPEPRRVLAGQSPSFHKETGPCFQEALMRQGSGTPRQLAPPPRHPRSAGKS